MIRPRALVVVLTLAGLVAAPSGQAGAPPIGVAVAATDSFPVQIVADRRAVWVLGTDRAGRATLRPIDVRSGRPLTRSRVVASTSETVRLVGGPAGVWLARERRGRSLLTRLDVTRADPGRDVAISGLPSAVPVITDRRAWTRARAGLVRFDPRSGRPLTRAAGGVPLALTRAALWTADLRSVNRDDAPPGIAGALARRDPLDGRPLATTAPISDGDQEPLLDPRADVGALRGSASGLDLWVVGAGGEAARVTPDGTLIRLPGAFADIALRGRSGYGVTRDGRRLLRFDVESGLVVGRVSLRIADASRARIAVTHLGVWVTRPTRRALIRVPHAALR